MNRKAFTLIELLVVIAIIAILAAILFPVFAQAKAAAKKTASLSNTKQLGTATYVYLADSDDTLPIFFTRIVGGVCLPTDTTKCGYRSMWQFHLYPYLKSWDLLTAPGETAALDPIQRAFNLSYGYNYGYLSTLCVKGDTLGGCPGTADPGNPAATQFFQAMSATAVPKPSDIFMFTDNGGKTFGQSTTLGSMVNPPDALPATKYFYGPQDVGWCKGAVTYFSKAGAALGGLTNTGLYGDTDGWAPKWSDGANNVFVDTHAKWMKVGAAAAGMSYSPTNTACINVKITDYSLQHWDPRAESGPGVY